MDKSNSLTTAWIDGKPTKPGLYVVEWLNGGGLTVLLATCEKKWRNVRFGKPYGEDDLWNACAIKRHILIPYTPVEQNHPAHYDETGGLTDEDRF